MFKNLKFIDHTLLFSALLLTALGVVIIYSISFAEGGSSLYIQQIVYAVLGIVLFFVFNLLDYRTLRGVAWIIYLSGILLLVIVLIFGRSGPAARWLHFGLFYLQPSELFKVISAIYLSAFLCDKEELSFRDILAYIIAVLLPLILILIQPDLGTAVVIFVIAAGLLLISKIKRMYLLALFLALLVMLPIGYTSLKDYQKERIRTFINPTEDPWGAGYNVLQSKIAIGSGGFFGRGLGRGSQSQLHFLPAQHTDFIFASLAEELGFVGAGILIVFYLTIAFRAIKISALARDNFGRFLSIGIVVMFVFQAFVNIGMNLGIMPVTGIPLPFVSSGGSSLLTSFISLGILGSIYLRHRKLSFEQ